MGILRQIFERKTNTSRRSLIPPSRALHKYFDLILIAFEIERLVVCLLAGLTSVMTKTISSDSASKLSSQSDLYSLSVLSAPAGSGSTPVALAQSSVANFPSTIAAKESFASQTKSHKKDPKHSLIAQQKSGEQQSRSAGLSSDGGSSSSRILNSTLMDASRADALPTPVAMVAGPSLDRDKDQSDEVDADHNSLDGLFKEPMYFGTENSTTIMTQVGANAHLPCIVHHIGEGVVSFAKFTHFFPAELSHSPSY